jgi:SP family general alpha glucoside:H+ symporter-like MFS transporter
VLPNGEKVITAPWQTGLSNSALVGEVIGLGLNGWASDRFGYRKTYMVSMAVMMITVLAPVLARSLPALSAGEVLMGIPWGVFQTLTTAYASEIAPVMLRPYLTSFVCACWGLGILLSSIVVKLTLVIPGEWSWRLPFALQWVWPIPLALIAFFAPESPWYLVRHQRFDDARKALKKLQTKNSGDDQHIEHQVAFMNHTNALEKAEQSGASYFECFKGTSLRRTEIVAVVWALQWLCGNPLMSYAVTFYRRAGLDENTAFSLNCIMNTTYLIGTASSWFLMRWFGRRTLYLAGCVMCCAHLIAIGTLGFFSGEAVSWATGSLLITFALGYNCTIGPVCYTIVAEIPSSRLRAKSIVLSRLTYVLTGLLTNTLTPRMLSPDAWNWGAKGAFLYLGTCALCGIWCWFRLPETANRTYAEVDELFARGIAARKFSTTQVNLYETEKRHAVVRADSLNDDKVLDDKDLRTATLDA